MRQKSRPRKTRKEGNAIKFLFVSLVYFVVSAFMHLVGIPLWLRNEFNVEQLLTSLNGQAHRIKPVNERQLVGEELARRDDAAVDEQDEIVHTDAGFRAGRAGLTA